MTKKIFHSILCVAAAVLLANLIIVMGCLYSYYRNIQEKQLQDELRLAAYAVEEEGVSYLEKLAVSPYSLPQAADYRFTWIAADGTVLYDTTMDADTMDNHKNRAEVMEAFTKGESGGVRYSETLTERTLYYARKLEDGTVLRISISQVTLLALVLGMLQPILIVAVFAVAFSAVLAHWLAKKIVRPLNALDLDHPLENDTYEELALLLGRIHQQHLQIKAQIQTLQKNTDEFAQVTAHMSEGLVLLDDREKILSINPAAQKIFDVDVSYSGREFLMIDRDRNMSEAIQSAMERGHSEIRAEKNGREYQFDISRIESDGAVIGTVLLAFDVTEQAAAERSRREFTANVSHELKTPLQSIMGSAELLENGLVKQEDIPQFISVIRTESARLVTLVEDIIHLSQLDENPVLPYEEADLCEIARDVASALQGNADKKHLKVTVAGGNVTVKGVGSFLYEMLYNLCDNAIKYNTEGGCVEISVYNSGGNAAVSVKDTGIGIPPEYQSRVFERFFRVDKSRSKASGGTGLGLSIVKHIAQYHHASIDLRSQAGKGTTISVIFP